MHYPYPSSVTRGHFTQAAAQGDFMVLSPANGVWGDEGVALFYIHGS